MRILDDDWEVTTSVVLAATGIDPRRLDRPLGRDPLPLETSRAGLFAAGDARHRSTGRVAATVGAGSMVAAHVFSRLAELGVTV